jgi:hypothetical protein
MTFSQKSETLNVTLGAGTVIQTRVSLFWENTILLALLRTVALNEEPLHCQLSVSLFWENTVLLSLLMLGVWYSPNRVKLLSG